MNATKTMTDAEFFARVREAGFVGRIVRSNAEPYQVEWTGHTETVFVGGEDYETVRVTGYASADDAVAAAESIHS
jgi:hypothetical protein